MVCVEFCLRCYLVKMLQKCFVVAILISEILAFNIEINNKNVEIEEEQILIPRDSEKDNFVYLINVKSSNFKSAEEGGDLEEDSDVTFQPWSILWYIGSFGGLIAFFLVVSCSEWCCRSRRIRSMQDTPCASTNYANETPPPAYDLFAPPPYDTLCFNIEKTAVEVFVLPAQTLEELTSSTSIPAPYYGDASNGTATELVLDVTQAEVISQKCKTFERT